MKKILAIFLILTILSGCTPAQELVPTEEQTSSPAETAPAVETPEPETEAEPEISQLPMVAVSVPLSVDTVTADSGEVLYRNTTQTMQLTMRDPGVADKIILDFLNRVDSHTDDANTIRQAALSADPTAYGWDTYFYDLIYNPTRVDHSVLSLYGESVFFDGGMHPQRICTAASYNMVTGDVLTLGSILYHLDAKNALADLVVAKLDALAEEKYLLDGYADVVRKRFQKDESFDEDWYFTTEGLCFYFAPYEIAPYSSGVIIAQIPYSELTGIIADEFFPAEEDLSQGDIQAVPVDSADMDNFTQITELTLDAEGQMFFLYTDGAVRNLTIECDAWKDGLAGEIPSYAIFGMYTLTPGDAIMLKVALSDETAQLRVSYESDGTRQTVILTPDFLNG